MTIEEFKDTLFCSDMYCLYKGETHRIMSVDFEEQLIGIIEMHGTVRFPEDMRMVRCENVDLVRESAAEKKD